MSDVHVLSADTQRLAQERGAGYCVAMDDAGWMILILIGGVVLWMVIRPSYRRWRAGKLADKMLEDVIKGKDAFRR